MPAAVVDVPVRALVAETLATPDPAAVVLVPVNADVAVTNAVPDPTAVVLGPVRRAVALKPLAAGRRARVIAPHSSAATVPMSNVPGSSAPALLTVLNAEPSRSPLEEAPPAALLA